MAQRNGIKKVQIFRCVSKDTGEEMTGIIYPDERHIRIGVDVWRELSKIDCASYPVSEFESIMDVKEQFEIVTKKKSTAYYMVS
mgnify:FL=1